MTIKQLATAAGVAASTVSDIETGRRALTQSMADNLARALDVMPNHLRILGGLTPDFFEQMLPTPAEPTRELTISLTAEEEARIREFLHFLRFRDAVLAATQAGEAS